MSASVTIRDADTVEDVQPDDIIVLNTLAERRLWPQFTERQCVTSGSFHRPWGRHFRRAYVTPYARKHLDFFKLARVLRIGAAKSGGDLVYLTKEPGQ